MTAQLAPSPVFRGFDNNGNPLAGGLLYTYQAGTTIPQPSYVDSTQTTPNTNPVVLNSRGECPLWLNPALVYKLLLTDSSGNQIPGWPVDNVPGGFIVTPFPQTQAEVTAGVTPTNTSYQQGDVRRYGALLNGSDDTNAMVQACAVAGNIYVPGPMSMASASLSVLTNAAITLQSNTTIRCINGGSITITGSSACNVFYSTDASNVTFIDVFCTGNGASSGTITTGYFWYSKHTAAAVQNATNLNFLRGGLTNFSGLYWMYFDNTAAATFYVSNVTIEGARFISQSGNAQNPSLITYTASIAGFSGSNTVLSTYTMREVVLRDNFADGTHLKNFCVFWSGTLLCRAYNNTLVGFGTGSEFTNDTGCYAINCYDFSHGSGLPPDQIDIFDNVIESVRDCGIYCASANPTTTFTNRINCHRNIISNQTSTANGTLLKGGIVYNSIYQGTIEGNVFYNCAFGISVGMVGATGQVNWLLNNVCEQMPNNGYAAWITSTFTTAAQKIVVDGLFAAPANSATGTTGVYVQATATVGLNNLDILNFDFEALNTGILVTAADSSVPALLNVRIANGKMRAITGTNLEFQNCTSSNQRTVLENLTFASMQANAVGLYMVGMLNLNIRNILFQDMTSGSTFCWYGGSAQGSVSGVQFFNVNGSNRVSGAASELGIAGPGWTGTDNQFVQYLDPSETGTTNSKYVVLGTVWDRINAAWKQCRALTGN